MKKTVDESNNETIVDDLSEKMQSSNTTESTVKSVKNQPSVENQVNAPARTRYKVRKRFKNLINTEDSGILNDNKSELGRIVSANGNLEAETEDSKDRLKRIDLLSSLNSRKLLTANIEGVETRNDKGNEGRAYATFMYGGIKVIIDVEDVIDSNPEYIEEIQLLTGHVKPLEYNVILSSWLTKRVGSEIDFIVQHYDKESNIVVASRKQAMLSKKYKNYIWTDRDDQHIIEVNKIVEARMCAINQKSIHVEIGGVETVIPVSEVSYSHIYDLTKAYNPGDWALVKILNIEIGENNNVTVTASMKQAQKSPYDAYSDLYNIQGKYIGMVTNITNVGIFVELKGGLSCLCKFVDQGTNPVRGSHVTVMVTHKDEERKNLAGLIVHIAAPSKRR